MDTVADLIRSLQQMPQDAPVFMSKDEEGNGYGIVRYVDLSKVLTNDDEYHPIHPTDWANKEYGENPDVYDAVYLWP